MDKIKKNWRLIIPLLIVGAIFVLIRSTQPSQEGSVAGVQESNNTVNMTATPNSTQQATASSELKIEDEKIGTGAEAISGKTVSVNYLGTLLDGTKFDSSYDRNQPFTFHLGAGEVIKGWDMGVAGMKVGGKRKLTIPSSLGYGDYGAPPTIPGGATLVFEVELLKVE